VLFRETKADITVEITQRKCVEESITYQLASTLAAKQNQSTTATDLNPLNSSTNRRRLLYTSCFMLKRLRIM
jgi:hypothetical protein